MVEIDKAVRRVHVRDLQSGRSAWEPYDHLLIATGAVPFCPDLPGANAADIYGVNTLKSGLDIRRRLDKGDIKKAIIVGGGYIGLEMAEALVMNGLEVSLISRPPQLMGTLDEDMGALVSQALRDVGVTLYLEEALMEFEITAGKVIGIVTDKRRLPADIVILGLGVRPNTALAAAAGIPLGEKGSIRVNERMETGVPGIWAAGDCAESFHLISRRPFYVALGTVIRGETYHFEIVSNESARGIMDLAVNKRICIGNGILTTEDEDQAWARARMSESDKGGGAARAALSMIGLKQQLLGAKP